jgi:thiamine-phosphate pyrophosphorylase
MTMTPAKPLPTAAARRIHGLYAIADSAYLDGADWSVRVAAALAGGARVLQFRDKRYDATTRARLARELVHRCAAYGVPVIINDDVALARACGAAGVHLGRDDADPGQARHQLGAGAIIGVSCYNDWQRARAAQQQGADYIAFGRFFPSRTKPEAVAGDPDLLRRARAELALPVVAIGGITPDNGAALITAGAHALAVIEGLWGQADVAAAAARYARLFDPLHHSDNSR